MRLSGPVRRSGQWNGVGVCRLEIRDAADGKPAMRSEAKPLEVGFGVPQDGLNPFRVFGL